VAGPEAGVRRARIHGVEYSLPRRVVTNDEIATAHPQWKMAQVARRTGVLQRHFAASNETALDLSHEACRLLLEATGTSPDRVEALIVCTQTPDFVMPPNACLLQDRLGLAKNVAAFDLTLACSGYIYGLFLAKALIESGALETVILVTADTYSRLISADDRGPYALFGDGAAATLLVAGETGLGEFVLGTDGSLGSAFSVPGGGARNPRSESTSHLAADRNGNLRSQEHIHMDGPGVLAFVQREVPGAVDCVLKKAGTSLSAVDLVLFHQASQVALDYLEEVLGIPPAKTFRNLERVGNTVSASLPMLLSDARRAGRLKDGDLVLLVGFGVGLSWGACLLEW